MNSSTTFRETMSPRKIKLSQMESGTWSVLGLEFWNRSRFGTMIKDLKNPETNIVKIKTIWTSPTGTMWMVPNAIESRRDWRATCTV